MYSSLIRSTFFRSREREIERRAALYDAWPDRTQIESIQRTAFNRTWSYCLKNVPFYEEWARSHNLPRRIDSLADLDSFPVLTKGELTERDDLVFQSGVITDAYSTGGSTGTPARFPRGAADRLPIYADVYVGRRWWGIRPLEPYVHIWGHAHLFGGSRLQAAKRRLADLAVNAVRLDAYNQGDAALHRAWKELLRRDPAYLIGYTSAIFKLARHIEAQGAVYRSSRLKAVVVTAETVSEADVEAIERVFAAPVVIEYGAAETGNIAVSRGSTWNLQVMWASCILRLNPAGEIHVTTLNERLFPLVNYAIGDKAVASDTVGGNALTLSRVLGRSQDVVRVRSLDGRRLELSAILPVHILKRNRYIASVQFKQRPDSLEIFLTGAAALNLAEVASGFVDAIRRDYPTFDASSVTFTRIEQPVLTRAGKHALIID